MAPIEISFVGTFSYDLRGGNSLIPWNSALSRWAPKNQGERETSATKCFFLGHLPGTPQLPYMTRMSEGPSGSTGIWKKKWMKPWRFCLVVFLLLFFVQYLGGAAWCSSWCFFLRSADVYFYFPKMKVFLLEVKLEMHKDKMNKKYNYTTYVFFTAYIYITFSIFLSWVGHDAIICQPLEDDFIYRSHDPDAWKLGPPKINSLKMHEDVRIDLRNPSVFAFWDACLLNLRKDFVKTAALLLHSTHRFRGQHSGMGYAPFHPVWLSWIIEI